MRLLLNTFYLTFTAIACADDGIPANMPDPLRMEDGTKVAAAMMWPARRAEILGLFENHVFGKTPGGQPDGFHFKETKRIEGFLEGKAVMREIRVSFTADPDGPGMDMLVVSPAGREVVPAFLGLNFFGNHTLHASPEIRITESWVPDDPKISEKNRATDAGRGAASARWPLETIINRGFALVTIYCGDIDPDFNDGFKNGVHPLFGNSGGEHAGDDGGSLAAWAWGLSRALDVLEKTEGIDAKRVAVIGHSRLGKAALWAGARDPRFAMVISNNSGCGGAALSRRKHGETLSAINNRFPHWFCGNFQKYNDREEDLPIDQHQLLALIAPRPLYVASATGDDWADPFGEFLSAKLASPVYELLGKQGVVFAQQPPPDQPVGATIGYHLRTGKHDITAWDWENYLDFAEKHFAENL